MYLAIIPNRNSKPAALLRESYREDGKVKNRTLANLSHLAQDKLDAIQRILAGEKLVPAEQSVQMEETLAAGHVRAVLGTMTKLGIPDLLSSRPCRERALVVGMIAERILHPASKLGTVRLWKTSTLAAEVGVEDATANDLYGALDWLVSRQSRIEDKLAARHLTEGGLALYDTSNSLYEGRTCLLARRGHDKEGRHGARIISYGLMTDREGRPIAIQVYPGNTGDPSTVPDQILKLRKQFNLHSVVLVGDRGMLTSAKLASLKKGPGLGWITALRTEGIRKLLDGGALQLSLFDEKDLAEITSPDFPGERLMACFNPLLADERKRVRAELLAATEKELGQLSAQVDRRTKKPMPAAEIGQKAGRVLFRHKVAKHFLVEIADGKLSWSRNAESIEREARLDGIYVIRTNAPAERMSAEDTVRNYKRLTEVEQAFRCLKGVDLQVRPIFHREDERVRAHFFLCMLGYYVEWHMRRALAPLLFQDEELPASRDVRAPVAKAEPSPSAKTKKKSRVTREGFPVHSFSTLLADLATQARVTYRIGEGDATFNQVSRPTPLHQRAFDLLGV